MHRLLIAALILASWTPLAAQAPYDSLTIRLRMVTPEGAKRIVGQLELVTFDSIFIRTSSTSEQRGIARSAVIRFERWAGKGTAIGRGAGMGLGLGLAGGLVAGIILYDSDQQSCSGWVDFSSECQPGLWIVGSTLGGGAVGALVGAVIGSTQEIDRWHRERLPESTRPVIVLDQRRLGFRIPLPGIR